MVSVFGLIAGRIPRFGALMGEGSPAPLETAGRLPHCLAFHGFSSTPLEVEPVVRIASELGLGAHAPLLPGHGTHVRDLKRTGWIVWREFARAQFLRHAAHGPVILAGLSLGTLLALQLAADHGQSVRALVLLANAIRLKSPYPALALEAVDRAMLPDFWMPKAAPDIADPIGRKRHLTYNAQPVHAAVEVLRAGERVRELLSRITAPTLILHGQHDRVCPVENANELAARLGSVEKRVIILPRSRHIVTYDFDARELEDEIRLFLMRHGG